MLLSQINSLFNNNITFEDFKKEIEIEVSNYRKNLSKKGSSSVIILSSDIKNLFVTKDDLTLLCNAFLAGKINDWELNYLAEGLLLSETTNFENEKVQEALQALTDPEYFELINNEFVEEVLEELSGSG